MNAEGIDYFIISLISCLVYKTSEKTSKIKGQRSKGLQFTVRNTKYSQKKKTENVSMIKKAADKFLMID